MRMSSLRTLGQREMRSTGCIVDDKRNSRLIYVKGDAVVTVNPRYRQR
jgi:hypothetical protein